MKHTAYISYGSNLGDKKVIIHKTFGLINSLSAVSITAYSSFYSSDSWGFSSENSFINGVIEISTELSVFSLLEALQRIEKSIGRNEKTTTEYADRLIDLDIIGYDNLVLNTPALTIPHEWMHVRNFVLEPLAEIAPEWTHPLYLMSAKNLLAQSKDKSEVRKIDAL